MSIKKRFFITAADIAQVENISKSRAREILRDIRPNTTRPKVTFQQYADYREQNVDEIKKFLGYE